MSRRKKAKKRTIVPDPIYNSVLVSKIINTILVEGKKTLAQHIFYEAMKNIEKFANKDSLDVLKKAVKNATPRLEVKPKRVGGAIYQIPRTIEAHRGNSLTLKLIIKNARKRPGRGMINKLTNEILDASNNTGGSIRKKEEIHKKAEANKAFSNIRNDKKDKIVISIVSLFGVFCLKNIMVIIKA
jgi:small subunit ribosomal protein S7